MKFRKIRLAGFKSFVEPAELRIEPGLTGIVGPNGCGKSNLLEALRWVMGENSSRSMRASAMDDVIFSGSASRPPRQMAEVVLTLDNAARAAPPPWREFDTLEVSRRIVREKGSVYRVNGREVRARDVQLLFADAGSGARSPALVRQGRIAELINARPTARRRLLEEAAGITGLHTRRHEAELKLNAAQANLSRLEDVVSQLESQAAALRRQARQARRYRELTDSIRRHEAALLWRQWKEAEAAATRADGESTQATTRQAELVRRVSMLEHEARLLREKLVPLRQEQAARAAAVQRVELELEGLGKAERAAARRRVEIEERLRQTRADLARAEEDERDAEAAMARLREEAAALRRAEEDEDHLRRAREALRDAEAEARERQLALEEVRARLAEREARLRTLEARRKAASIRLEKLRAELATHEERGEQARAGDADARVARLREALDAARRELDDAARALALARRKREEQEKAQAETAARCREAEEAERAAREVEEERRAAWDEQHRALVALDAEVRALERLLGAEGEQRAGRRVIDALEVEAGFEKALAAALGEDVEAELEADAPLSWRALPPLGESRPLPHGIPALAEKVRAPRALARRLASIGVVSSREQAEALHAGLHPGQRLVSLRGDVWRWDGLVATGEAETPAARRLAARNRLKELRGHRRELEAEEEAARAALERARQARADAGRSLRQAREAEQEATHAMRLARQREEEARRQEMAARAALEKAGQDLREEEARRAERLRQAAALDAACERLRAQMAEMERELVATGEELVALPADDDLREQLRARRDAWEEAQKEARAAHARVDALERERRLRAERLEAVAREKEQWEKRRERAGQRVAELRARLRELDEQLRRQSLAPEEMERRRARLRAELRRAEQAAAQAAASLSEMEEAVRGKEREWQRAQQELADVKATLAAARARTQAAGERLGALLATIEERMDCRPQLLLARSGFAVEECPTARELERALHEARAARERLGAVNLRADIELRETEEELARLKADRDDVQKAIDKLRGAIGSLNREGRKRLLRAFDQVNAHFAALFDTLFGGGKAHLELIESDDPLDAGLEIFAQPPGKRLTTLTLLSGGEQTLTALALIFAVFLVNPSPICVLDEVDAPLDEHNVERFCNLLDGMLERASTDFLIITHHPLTMARMHRLYGVTMMEPGVSRLVSVDLRTAEQLREAS